MKLSKCIVWNKTTFKVHQNILDENGDKNICDPPREQGRKVNIFKIDFNDIW